MTSMLTAAELPYDDFAAMRILAWERADGAGCEMSELPA